MIDKKPCETILFKWTIAEPWPYHNHGENRTSSSIAFTHLTTSIQALIINEFHLVISI